MTSIAAMSSVLRLANRAERDELEPGLNQLVSVRALFELEYELLEFGLARTQVQLGLFVEGSKLGSFNGSELVRGGEEEKRREEDDNEGSKYF